MTHKTKKGKYHQWITEDGLTLIEGWARDGLSDVQIAANIGIAAGTLYTWKKQYNEIDESLKKGKEVVDMEVENAMLKRAKGYEFEEVKTYIEDYNGQQKKRVEKTVKHVPSDVTAAIFWLRNRKGQSWSNREDVDVAKLTAETELIKVQIRKTVGEIETDTLVEDKLEAYFEKLDSVLSDD